MRKRGLKFGLVVAFSAFVLSIQSFIFYIPFTTGHFIQTVYADNVNRMDSEMGNNIIPDNSSDGTTSTQSTTGTASYSGSSKNHTISPAVYNQLSSDNGIDWINNMPTRTEEEMTELVNTERITGAVLNSASGNLYMTFESGQTYKVVDISKEFINYLKFKNIEISTSYAEEGTMKEEKIAVTKKEQDKGSLAIMLIAITAAILLMYDKMGRRTSLATSGSSSSDALVNQEAPTVTLADVEGVEGLKADVMGVVDYLKNPQKYIDIGARVPKGIILYGPPGTGKTLLAKAVAGEAGVPFFNAVGSDFVEKYVGVGASRVRELYKKARSKAPCIVFIDEIDAVAGQRGNDTNSERDQTINALLAELDGFNGSENVITICATNRLDMLDEAFQRAGRFDLKLAVGLPDKNARFNILKIHGRNKKFAKGVNLESVAVKTQQFSGAELEALLNESALEAVRKGKQEIDNEDIDDAFFKIVMKGNKKKRENISETNKVVAWHEAGHTLATKLLTDDNVPSVTIVGSASGAGGVTFRTQKDDMVLHSKKYLENSIKIMYAGRAAEEIYFADPEEVTTGASQDIKQATSIIKEYLSSYGMGCLGMIDLSQFRREAIDVIQEASELANKLYTETVDLLSSNKIALESLATELLEKETLEEPQIDAVIHKALKIQEQQKNRNMGLIS